MFRRRLFSVTSGLRRNALRQDGHAGFSIHGIREAWTDASGRTHFGPTSGGAELNRKYLYYFGFAAGASGLVYYKKSEKVPITGRTHLVLLNEKQELAMGKSTFDQVSRQFSSRTLPEHSPDAQRVRRVSSRLLAAAMEPSLGLSKLPHLAGVKWRFLVVESPQLNAFCLPGGHVVVFTGLMRLLPDDAELATVLAHEIAHVVARHSAEKVSTGAIGLAASLALALAVGGDWGGAVALGLDLPFSRRAETEADCIGLRLMSRACYDPLVAPGVFRKLGRANAGVAPPEYLSTHPSDATRVAALEKAAPEALQQYQDAGCRHVAGHWPPQHHRH